MGIRFLRRVIIFAFSLSAVLCYILIAIRQQVSVVCKDKQLTHNEFLRNGRLGFFQFKAVQKEGWELW